MLQQPDAGIETPDGIVNPAKAARLKGGPLSGGANLAATSGATVEQQAQRCPRCDSLNTKFCYYNNYSLSQPRHFCKNCRRYWTKGGSLRNVPVGGGCRKNKRLKHRDPSCLAALADIDASGPSSILSTIHGLPGLGTSTSSLIQELANEGNRLAFSRLGMPMFDKHFITGHDHHHQHPASSSAQDLFAMGGPPAAVGAFDPSFPALTYNPKGDSHSIMFHPQHASEFTPFFDPIHSPSSLTPTLDHLSSFAATTPTAAVHHVNATTISNTANMDALQMSLIHHMPVNGMQASHGEQQAMQTSSGGGSFNQEEEIAEISLRSSKGKSIISSLPDWGQQSQGAPPAADATGADSCFFVSPPLGDSNDNGLWNVSWPEMHAALAGSAGAMLH